MSVWLQILLNGTVLAALLLPAIRSYYAGFVKTVLHFLRYLIALVLSSVFVSPFSAFLKRAWLDRRFYDLILEALRERGDLSAETNAMIDALPVGIRRILAAFRFDFDAFGVDVENTREELLRHFARSVSERVADIAATVLAFSFLFVASLLALFLLSRFLNFLFDRLSFFKKVNRWFGLLIGLAVGVLCASLVSQVIAVVLTTFTDIDYSLLPLVRFFQDIGLLRWIFLWFIRRMQ